MNMDALKDGKCPKCGSDMKHELLEGRYKCSNFMGCSFAISEANMQKLLDNSDQNNA